MQKSAAQLMLDLPPALRRYCAAWAWNLRDRVLQVAAEKRRASNQSCESRLKV
jgi:hypothetical protein